MRITVVGDTTWDVTVRATEIPPAGADRPARIHVGPGGQGANLAVRLARRGADVRLVTALGTDPIGSQLAAALAAERVTVVILASERSGIVVSLVGPAGDRAMLSDRVPFDVVAMASDAVRRAMADADWIHLSGYPLTDADSGAALAELGAARRRSQRCSVGGGSFAGHTDVAARLRTVGPDLVLFDRSEAAAVLAAGSDSGADSDSGEDRSAAELATDLVATLGAVAVVTGGPAEAAGATSEGVVTVAGPPLPAIDATGAGDAHAAALIAAVAAGAWPPPLESLRAALQGARLAGAEVAAVLGSQTRVPSEAGP